MAATWFARLEEQQREFEVAADPSCRLYPALTNPAIFPPFSALTEMDDPSTNYYTGWDTGLLVRSRNWALVAEVVQTAHDFRRPRFKLRTRDNETVFLHFYEESPPLKGFEVQQVMVGHTFVLLSAEKHKFMDLTEGVRMEYLETCWAFKGTLAQVSAEGEKLLTAADAVSSSIIPRCFLCDQETSKKCGKCKRAYFCSRECQTAAWPVHRGLCPDAGKLLKLASLPRSPYEPEEGNFLDWNTIPDYIPFLPLGANPEPDARE